MSNSRLVLKTELIQYKFFFPIENFSRINC